MSYTESQFRSILREEAADITAESVPPLWPPDPEPTGLSRGRAGVAGLRWRRWLIPLGAAATVAAIAVAATVVANGGPLPPSPTAESPSFHGAPPYFIALEEVLSARAPAHWVVHNTATGAVVAEAVLPRTELPDVTATEADGPEDRSFVLAAEESRGPEQILLAHFSPVSERITFRRLPITPPSGDFAAMAVSPDGSEIAVEVYQYPAEETEIRIYSLTGAALRTWRVRDDVGPGSGPNNFAWGPDGMLAFSYHGGPSDDDGIRLLPASAPSGDLLRASRLTVRLDQPAGYQVGPFLMTDRGSTFLTLLVRSTHLAIESKFAAYSADTGRELRTFWSSRGTNEGLVWSNPSGGAAVVWAPPRIAGPHSSGLGVLSGGRFFPIPIRTGRVGEPAYVAIAF
jgi:hypothetical protein